MWLDLIGSAGFGGLLGGVFGWLGKREENAGLKLTMAHEINLITAKTNASIQIAKMGVEEAIEAGKLAVDKMEAEAFNTSMVTSNKYSEFMKSFIRPVILALLLYQTWAIITTLEELTGGLKGLGADEVLALYRLVVLSVTGLTATAVGWYFGARSSKQFDKLLDQMKPRRYDEEDY